MKIKSLVFLLIAGFLFSCETKKTPYFNPILKSDTGAIRGVFLGNTFEEVKQLENDSFLIDQMNDYLYYDYEINMGNNYTVSYDFTPKGKLYEIEITTYLDEKKDAILLFKDFDNYFTKKYGNSTKIENGFTIWKNENDMKIKEFSMLNKSETYGIIVIKIYNQLNK